jgi:hypothetical protein
MGRTWRNPDLCEIVIEGVPRSLRAKINKIARVYKGIDRNTMLRKMLFEMAEKHEAEQKEKLKNKINE